MSLFLYCTAAVLIAFAFGRANRSINLFWELLIAFGIGAIGAAIVQKCTTSGEEKTNVVTVLTPEQGLPASIQFTTVGQDALNSPTATFVATLESRATVSDNNVISRDNFTAASRPKECIRGQPWVAMGTYDTS